MEVVFMQAPAADQKPLYIAVDKITHIIEETENQATIYLGDTNVVVDLSAADLLARLEKGIVRRQVPK